MGWRIDKKTTSVAITISHGWLGNDSECAERRRADLRSLDIARARLQIRNLSTQEKNYELARISSAHP
jgi:hypothetical protein